MVFEFFPEKIIFQNNLITKNFDFPPSREFFSIEFKIFIGFQFFPEKRWYLFEQAISKKAQFDFITIRKISLAV